MSAVFEAGGHIPGLPGFVFGVASGAGVTATPSFSPGAGSYASTQTVTITCSTPSSSIYFTTDGTTPTFPITGSTALYTAPITVASTETVKAIGVATGLANSAVGSATYTIGGTTFNFFISTTGSDSNSGTSVGSPWAITSLIDNNSNNHLIAGKNVGLIAGTYDISALTSGDFPGSNSNNYPYPILHLPAGSATASTYIASCNSSGVYTARASTIIITASNTGCNSIMGQDQGGNGYWTIDGIVFDGGGTFPSTGGFQGGNGGDLISYFPSGLSAGPAVIQNCELRNLIITSGSGENKSLLSMQGQANSVITNCYFHDLAHPSDTFHCHAIECYNSNGAQISLNTFVNCNSAIDFKVNNVGGNVFGNYVAPTTINGAFFGFDGNQLTQTNIANSIHHNVFDNAGQVRENDVNSTILQNINFYNNTVYDTRSGSKTIVDLRCTGTGNSSTVYNNIYVSTTGSGSASGAYAIISPPNSTISDYQCFAFATLTQMWGVNYPASVVTFNSLASWQASSTAGNPDAHSISGGSSFPAFVSSITVGNGPTQFQLGGSSPCLNAGKTGGTSGGSSVNMGAWDGTYSTIGANFVSYPGS